MAGILPGKLLGVTIGDSQLNCQIDGSLSITVAVTDTEPCKPTITGTMAGGSWTTHSIDSKSWTISVSAKAFADAIATNNSDISELLITGSPSVEVEFLTIKTTDYDFDETFVYSGTGTITNFTLNAPVTGEATYDLEITGNGALTFTSAEVV